MSFLLRSICFVFVLNILNTFASPTRHLCRPDEKNALLEFVNEFEIRNLDDAVFSSFSYPKTNSWSNKSDCCSWDGITCHAKSGEVVELDLSSSCFHGKLSSKSSLFKLQRLRVLNLAYNDLVSSEIPSQLGTLKELTLLNLSNTLSSGPIPTELLHLTKLVSLDLSSNSLSAQKSFLNNLSQNLTNLEELNLGLVDISSEIPPNISKLSSLKSLSLDECNLFGKLPSSNLPVSINNLKHLTTLKLGFCNLHGQISSSLGNLTNLSTLDLSSNFFNGHIPSSFGNLLHLTSLVLSSNRLSGQIPPSFANLNQLTTLSLLSLVNNHFTGTLPPNISALCNLETFEASENIFTGTLPSTLFNTPSLTYIDLKDNQLNAILEFGNISSPSKLERLSLGNNHFKGSLPISISSLLIVLDLSSNAFQGPLFDPPVSTEALVVSNNNFTGKIPESICEQRYLQTLDLSNNSFTGSIPQCLKNLNISIDVSQNRLVGKLPRSLKSCTSLEVLNVRSNGIDDTFPFWLNTLPELKVIVLRNNNFKGPLHRHHPFGFPKLQIIDVSNNGFNGTLPSDYFSDWNMTRREDRSGVIYIRYNDYYHDSMVLMSKGVEMKLERILKLLTAIDLSGNELSGKIPESIGLLKDLIVLNLSSNGFTGDIPSSFGNQSQLESLDLSNNKLSGSIPPSLGDLSSLSYIKVSNNQLHGPIPQSTQFQTQSASSFEGNLGLCGLPLSEKCGEQSQEPEAEEAEEEEGVLSWTAAAIALAPGVILGLTIGHILVTQKTHWFMRFLA
ncbi:BnaA02g30080D [Brassica napus]|uniref:BnaA02g30080D protein n=1 Tax=Brassica napus TaxID=3708 RepID=A0A078IFF8_BRANA|nr:BnaA02g30080D [Brassica napus]